jgi:CheY-like chemotaxis protein
MSGERRTILIVDDTPENIMILTRLLSNEYAIFVANNGQQALQRVSETLPDLILLDILMPGMDGYQVCARLKAEPHTAKIPVVFVTGLTEESDEQKGLELGAVDYIVRPISPALLRARVRNHLELKIHRDHLEALVKERTAELEAKNISLAEEIAARIRIEKEMVEQSMLLVEQVDDRVRIEEELRLKQQQLAELNEQLEQRIAEELHKTGP